MIVKITHNKEEKFWELQLSEERGVKYPTLFKLARALMKFAKGQNL